jgi:selenocysteine lyase/cysteine desulfurase
MRTNETPKLITPDNSMKRFIYLDNAATSFPKPQQVMEAMIHYMKEVGANPDRSGHQLSIDFNSTDPTRIVFTINATESLNIIIYGFLNPGDNVIISSMEHNSVMRPLKHLEESSVITVTIAHCDNKGFLDIDALVAKTYSKKHCFNGFKPRIKCLWNHSRRKGSKKGYR